MRHLAAADCCYGAALLTMPLVGVGLIHLVTGLDPGAGLQPAYLLFALAWLLRLGAWLRVRGAGGPARLLAACRAVPCLHWLLVACGALLVSWLGLRLAPSPLLPHEALPRFWKQSIQIGVMLACLLYAACWTRGPRRWRWTIALLGWSLALQLVYAVLQAVDRLVALPGMALLERVATSNPAILSGSAWLYLGSFVEIPRLRGSMCEPLYLGNLLVGVLPLLTWAGRRGLAAGGCLVLLLTWSRGAWAAGVATLLIWWLLRRRAGLPGPSPRQLQLVIAGLGVGLLTVALVGGPGSWALPIQRLWQTFDQSDWSNLTRYYSWQAAWRAWLQSPLVGVGWGQYPYHFYALVDLPGLASQFSWPVVNSFPLLVLCETGMIGFFALCAAAMCLGRRTWQDLADETQASRRARLAALAAGVSGLGLHLMVFSQYNLPHLWVLPGLWLAALAETRGRRPGAGK